MNDFDPGFEWDQPEPSIWLIRIAILSVGVIIGIGIGVSI